jgi:hypothetical protein
MVRTTTKGIFQSDILLRTAIMQALLELRANPWLLDYVFAWLPADALTAKEYGDRSVEEAKAWFLNTDIAVSLAYRYDAPQYPLIAIELQESSESGANSLGDVHYEATEDVSATEIVIQPGPVLGPFTPNAYDSATGVITLPKSLTTEHVFEGNLVYDSVANKAYPVVAVLGDNSFAIAPGTKANFKRSYVAPHSNFYTAHLESVEFRETYKIRAFVNTGPLHLTFLHSIITFILLRWKQDYLEGRGFERTTVSAAGVFPAEGPNDAEIIFARDTTITGYVRQYWPKQVVPKIDGIILDLTIESPSPTPAAIQSSVFDQGWDLEGDQFSSLPTLVSKASAPAPSATGLLFGGTIDGNLTVTGDLRVGGVFVPNARPFSQFPAASNLNIGALLWDTTNGALKLSNGTTWRTFPTTAAELASTATGGLVSTNVQAALEELYAKAGNYVLKSGDTMTGALLPSGTVSLGSTSALWNKLYVNTINDGNDIARIEPLPNGATRYRGNPANVSGAYAHKFQVATQFTDPGAKLFGLFADDGVTERAYFAVGGAFFGQMNSRGIFVASLATPTGIVLSPTTGTLPPGTYYYRVSATGLGGSGITETLASTETSITLNSTGGVQIDIPYVFPASGYRIYGRSAGAEQFIAAVATNFAATYVDDGSLTPSGNLPTINNTGVIAPNSTNAHWLGLPTRVWNGLYALTLRDAVDNVRVNFVATANNTYKDNSANSSTAIAHNFDTTNAFSISGAKLMQIRNGGVEKVYIDKDGTFTPSGDGTTGLGGVSNRWSNLYLSNALRDASAVDRVKITNASSNTYKDASADGSSAIGHVFDTNAFANTSAKLAEFRNGGTAKIFISYDGRLMPSSALTGTVNIGGSSNMFATIYAQAIQDSGVNTRLGFQPSTNNAYRGAVADGASATAHIFSNVTALVTPGSKIAKFFNDASVTERSHVDYLGGYNGPLKGYGLKLVQVNAPTGVGTSTSTSGGTLAAGTYYYRVSAVDVSGLETAAAAEVSQVTTGSTSTVTISWNPMFGAVNYKVYGRTTGAELLIGSLTAGTTSFTDDGSVTPSGALPTGNLTGSITPSSDNAQIVGAATVRFGSGYFVTIRDGTSVARLNFSTNANSHLSPVLDSTNNIGHIFDTSNNLTASGSAIVEFRNSSATKARITKDGAISSQNGVYSVIGANSAVLRGNVADGSTAIGVKISNANQLVNGSARIVSFYNDQETTEKAFVRADGAMASLVFLGTTSTASLRGVGVDGSTQVAAKIGNGNALVTAGAKILSLYNDANITEQAYFDLNGSLALGLQQTTTMILAGGTGATGASITTNMADAANVKGLVVNNSTTNISTNTGNSSVRGSDGWRYGEVPRRGGRRLVRHR